MSDDFFAEFDATCAELARRSRTGHFSPHADVYLSADGTAMLVDIDIAGADPADLRVMVEARTLYVSGRRYDRRHEPRGSVLLKEIAYGEFAKTIQLPVAVAAERATAAYRDGMLTIRLPVSDRATLPKSRTEIRMTIKRIPA